MSMRLTLFPLLVTGLLSLTSVLKAQSALLDYQLVEARQFGGHADTISSIAFSPDARLVAAGTTHGAIRVWEIKSGRQISVYDESGTIRALEFSNDSKFIYFGGAGIVVQRWNPFNGEVKEIIPLARALHGNSFVSIRPKAKRVLTGPGWAKNPRTDELPPVRLWDLETGRALKEWKLPAEKITDVSLTPDAKRILATATYFSNTKTPIAFHARVWSAKSGRNLMTYKAKSRGGIDHAALSTDGRFAYAVGPKNAETRIWNIRSGKLIEHHTFHYRKGGIDALAPFPESHLVAAIRSYGRKTNLSVLDFSKGRELAVADQGEFKFNDVIATSPDARWVGAATNDHKLHLYRVKPARRGVEPLPTIALKPGDGPDKRLPNKSLVLKPGLEIRLPARSRTFAVSPDEKLLATGHRDGSVFLWDAVTGKRLRKIAKHDRRVARVVFTPDGKSVLSSGSALLESNLIRRRKPRVLLKWREGLHGDHLDFTPDGKSVVIGGYIGHVTFIDIASEEVGQEFPGFTFAMALSPDGKTLVTARENKLRFYNTENGFERDSILHPGSVKRLLFTKKGKTLISASDDGKIRFWDASSLKEKSRIDVGVSSFVGPALAGDKLLAVSRMHTIQIWDIKTGRQIALLNEDASNRVMDLNFTQDGKLLIGCFSDQTLRRWNVTRGRSRKK